MKDPYKMILKACTPRGYSITGGQILLILLLCPQQFNYEIGRKRPNGGVRRIIWFSFLKDEVFWSPPGDSDPWRHLTDLNDPKSLDVIRETIRREVENDRNRSKSQ